MITHLEHRQPEANCFRFYRVELARDLFGAWCRVRCWGRIGGRGRQQIDSFASREAAERACETLATAKRRRGYVGLAGA